MPRSNIQTQYLYTLPLPRCYQLWDALSDVPTRTDPQSGVEELDAAFLHFEAGTPREDVWHWFEARNPDFVVGEVLQGQRREGLALC